MVGVAKPVVKSKLVWAHGFSCAPIVDADGGYRGWHASTHNDRVSKDDALARSG